MQSAKKQSAKKSDSRLYDVEHNSAGARIVEISEKDLAVSETPKEISKVSDPTNLFAGVGMVEAPSDISKAAQSIRIKAAQKADEDILFSSSREPEETDLSGSGKPSRITAALT